MQIIIRSNAVYAVLETYPEHLRALFLDINLGATTPELLPLAENLPPVKDPVKKKAKKTFANSSRQSARRSSDIRARLNEYVLEYSADLQKLFDDIVAANAASPETGNTKHNSSQRREVRLPVHGSQYLKQRLELMQRRSKISVMPLIKKKKSKKKCVKRKRLKKMVDKLQILRKKFQLMKKDDPSSLNDQKTKGGTSSKPRKKLQQKEKNKVTGRTGKTLLKNKNKKFNRKMKIKQKLQRKFRKRNKHKSRPED